MKSIEVKNAGPVRDFTIPLDKGPGIYEIVGENGEGKTNMLLAIARALGNDVPAVLRDGARELSVTLDNQVLLSLTKVTKAGDVEGALMSSSPIANLILPNVKDADAAEERRIQALLKLIDLPVTDEAIRTLCDQDENAFEFVMQQEGDTIRDLNIVEAKERVRRRLHEMKRGVEGLAQRAQAEIDVNTVEKPTVLSKKTPALARAEYEDSVAVRERLKGEASQRKEREAEREEIRGTIGKRPDVGAYQNGVSAARERLQASCDYLATLKERLVALRREIEAQEGAVSDNTEKLDEAQEALALAGQSAASWARRKAILDSKITGATDADVEAATAEAEKAAREVERARQTCAYNEACQRRKEAQETRERALEEFDKLEKLATGVTGRLGLLLSQAGVEGLTVDEDRLCLANADGSPGEAFYRLSFGERAKIACRLLASQRPPRGLLALPWQFFASLSPENRQEAVDVFSSHGLYVLTERPAAGELRVEHLGNGGGKAEQKPKSEKKAPKGRKKVAA